MSDSVRCLIVDDEPLAIALMQAHIEQIPQLTLVDSCQNALAAFEVLKREKIDLLFLDIQMPVLSGMEFVKSLKEPPAIIFTTAHRQYALESYELNVVDYLLKPIAFIRFFKAINKYLDTRTQLTTVAPPKEQPPTYLFVNVNKKNLRIAFEEILYVESLKDYLRIVTKSQSIVTKSTITAFEKTLPNSFCRVHRSYIVNLEEISAYTQQDIEIG
ncbi:MAG: LytR/AlgR family response regulator transcription factor, partial [Bacteroidia bacterium]